MYQPATPALPPDSVDISVIVDPATLLLEMAAPVID
jgi:hypothetical protein